MVHSEDASATLGAVMGPWWLYTLAPVAVVQELLPQVVNLVVFDRETIGTVRAKEKHIYGYLFIWCFILLILHSDWLFQGVYGRLVARNNRRFVLSSDLDLRLDGLESRGTAKLNSITWGLFYSTFVSATYGRFCLILGKFRPRWHVKWLLGLLDDKVVAVMGLCFVRARI